MDQAERRGFSGTLCGVITMDTHHRTSVHCTKRESAGKPWTPGADDMPVWVTKRDKRTAW